MSAEVKNLEALSKAIDQHNRNCVYVANGVALSPFEIERLGWEEIRGLPIIPTTRSAPAASGSSVAAAIGTTKAPSLRAVAEGEAVGAR